MSVERAGGSGGRTDRLRFAETVWKSTSFSRKAAIVTLFVVAYAATDIATNLFEPVPGVSSLYPPAGIAFAFFILYGRRWAGAFLAALIASALTSTQAPIPMGVLIPSALTKLCFYLGSAELVRRQGFDPLLRRPRDVASIAIAALLTPIAVAVILVFFVYSAGADPLRSTIHFWLGDFLGILSMTPLLVILWGERELRRLEPHLNATNPPRNLRAVIEAPSTWFVLAVTLASTLVIFYLVGLVGISSYTLFMLPMIWAALKGGVRSAVVSMTLVILSTMGWHWFNHSDPMMVVETQILISSLSIAALFTGAATTSRRTALNHLSDREEHLDRAEKLARMTSFEWEPATGRITAANGLHRLTGIDLDGKTTTLDQILDFVVADERSSFLSALAAAVDQGGRLDRTVTFEREFGPVRFQCSSVTRKSGGTKRVLVICRDVTSEASLARDLELREERWRRLMATTRAVSWEAADKLEEFTNVAPYAEKLLKYPLESWYRPSFWVDHIHPEDRDRVLSAHEKRGDSETLTLEYRMLSAEGTVVWVRDVVEPSTDPAHQVQGFLFNVTARRRVEEQIHHVSLHDRLTGLPNRALVRDRFVHALATLRDDETIALLQVDLSRFKLVNDTLGGAIGDEVLRQVGSRLSRLAGKSDTVARVSGDEFVILCEGTQSEPEVVDLGLRVISTLTEPMEISGHEIHVGAHCGLTFASAGEDSELVMRRADIALFSSKSKGESNLEIFEPSMEAQFFEKKQLEDDLRLALDRGELLPHYQPVVSLETGVVTGLEALMRWNHPERGVLPPGNLIAMAEETGVITRVDFEIMRQACIALANLKKTDGRESLSMAVNISALHFRNHDVVARIREILSETGVDASSLHIELTESVLIGNYDVALEVMNEIVDLGVGIYLDDFGTGYASLVYLRRFPFCGVKIDRSFVSSMSVDSGSRGVVRSIVTLGHSLNLSVTAEGVEEQGHVDELRNLGCERAQGFLFSPALPEDELELLLADKRFTIGEVDSIGASRPVVN